MASSALTVKYQVRGHSSCSVARKPVRDPRSPTRRKDRTLRHPRPWTQRTTRRPAWLPGEDRRACKSFRSRALDATALSSFRHGSVGMRWPYLDRPQTLHPQNADAPAWAGRPCPLDALNHPRDRRFVRSRSRTLAAGSQLRSRRSACHPATPVHSLQVALRQDHWSAVEGRCYS